MNPNVPLPAAAAAPDSATEGPALPPVRTPCVVLYHARCTDGFAAAWAAHTVLGPLAEYVPVSYGTPPPAVPDGADVYVLDFSYDEAGLAALGANARSVTVLDHHRSAIERYVNALPGSVGPEFRVAETVGKISVVFDMAHSGAVLAWQFFHPGEPVPRLLQYVEDRDLWAWNMPFSRTFSSALAARPQTFDEWDRLAGTIEAGTLGSFLEAGRAVLSVQCDQVDRAVSHAGRTFLGGQLVPVVNSPLLQSEIGERLLEQDPDAPFVAVWHQAGPARVVVSLRARPGFDCSRVAAMLGGGGHAGAAAFTAAVPPVYRA